MTRRASTILLVIFAIPFATVIGWAQQPPAAPLRTVKLEVVVSKYEGDKRISTKPYTLSVVPGQSGNLRVGAEVPVPTNVGGPNPSYTMQNIGTQVDAQLSATPEGRFNVKLTVTDRSQAGASEGPLNVPVFRNMTAASSVILGDGETTQFTSALDDVSKQTLRVDVTLRVDK